MQLDWLEVTSKIFEMIVFPAIALVAISIITFVKAKKTEVLENTKSELTKKYVEMLDATITDCVLSTSQTFVSALKQQGAFDEAAQKQAFKLTYDAVVATLTDEAQKYLNEAINDLNTYITNKIEAKVLMSKTV